MKCRAIGTPHLIADRVCGTCSYAHVVDGGAGTVPNISATVNATNPDIRFVPVVE